MHVDVRVVRAIADSFNQVAELVDQAARVRLQFGGAVAGRAHIADGDAVARALDRMIIDLAQWSRAAAEIGVCLGAGADRYADADHRAAAGIG